MQVSDENDVVVSISRNSNFLFNIRCSISTSRLIAVAVLGGGTDVKVISSGTLISGDSFRYFLAVVGRF
jgi:hypothetical protein